MKHTLLFVSSHSEGIGGGEIYLSTLVHHLRQEYHTVLVDCGGNAHVQRLAKASGCAAIETVSCGNWRRDAAHRIRQICRRRSVSLIHFNSRRDIALAWQLRDLGLPMVMTVHTGFTSRHLGIRENAKGVISATLGRLFGRCMDRYITVTEHNARSIRMLLGLPESKVTTIHNGIEVASSPCITPWTSDNPRRICAVARLVKAKGVHVLLEALSMLLPRDLPAWECVVIGDGPEYAQLRRQAEAYHLGNHVAFTGHLPNEDVLGILASSYAAVLPSFYEGLPISLLEAMARGLPIVATRVQGLAELVHHGENGLLVRPHSSQDLAEALTYLLEHPDVAASMGTRGRELTQEEFSINRMMGSTRAVYAALLQPRCSGSPGASA